MAIKATRESRLTRFKDAAVNIIRSIRMRKRFVEKGLGEGGKAVQVSPIWRRSATSEGRKSSQVAARISYPGVSFLDIRTVYTRSLAALR